MRKTKIICTIGPACEDKDVLMQMCHAGMNVARLNFSHGSHEEHQKKIDLIKATREQLGMPIAIMLDTKGPEYRIKTFGYGKIRLDKGDIFTFTTEDIIGNKSIVAVNYDRLMENLSIGDTILVNNGLVVFKVIDLNEKEAKCEVVVGGELTNRKSMNFPNKVMNHCFLSEQDKEDLLFGIQNGVDFIAASFVSQKQDIEDMRNFLDQNGGRDIDIIAKIENRSGVDNIEEICEIADGIMIARGDLGVEIPAMEVPVVQKYLIQKCRLLGKRVITATEMLESMIHNPRPTRAEISDVANAVYDGTSAVMLSGESAAGKYPVESVKALDAICFEAEQNGEFTALKDYIERNGIPDKNPIRGSICRAARDIAQQVGAKAIIVESATGRVARAMVHFRSDVPIIAVVTSSLVCKKLCLNWGVTALIGEEKKTSDAITKQAMEKALSTGVVKKGDTVVVLSSNKTCPTSSTDSLNVRIL